MLPDQVSYNFDVGNSIDKCYTCHGPDPKSVQGEFRHDIKDNWYRISQEDPNKPIITPGHIDRSELINRIRSTRSSHKKMPPPESNLLLSEEKKRS